ncbi:long-chain fatty acid--CoA ligase [Hazenella sp. IB182357]|uniref:Long-chain fatty acid--CoA ligase n=1 Tax=Polycladospora coralii TaxID=2771432 RepID=A0A926NB74_9BACL|nr:long-chain fatty acid--CoA ligase [Polycladospora coralii]MBD1373328.1 long-chain fatty acid--CoA ligase [Polycladospora coralii]
MKRPWDQHVAKGNPKQIDIPKLSLPQFFMDAAKKYPKQTAITFFEQTYTYEKLADSIQRLASAWVQYGIEKGDRIAIMLPNCPAYPISFYATVQCGAIVVQVNPMYQPDELLHVFQDSEPRLLIILDKLIPVVQPILDQTSITRVIEVSLDRHDPFHQLLQQTQLTSMFPIIDPPKDVAVIQYTGGTTGRSKGAMLTHYNIVANTLQGAATARVITEKGKEKLLAIAPLCHVYGMTGAMCITFYNGGNLILVPRFEVESVVKLIEKMKPTHFPGAPTMYIALLQYYQKHSFDLSCLKACTSGSAPLPVEVINRFNQISKTSVSEGYGLSEASPVTHRNPIVGIQKHGSIGIPVPNTDAKIVDITTGENTLACGEVGELIIKGPQIMKGYWKMPEETALTLRDGWLFTGDLAKMDEDGFFYIVGRKKELIIASGYNVYPIEVEDVLYRHEKILEACVIGIPDAYRGETVKAVVVLKPGEQLSAEELILFCRKRLAAYKVPTHVTFTNELPKTFVGKILKRKLKESGA